VPDIVMTAVGNPPATVVAGQTFPAATSYSVTNTGAVEALPSTAKFSLVSGVVGAGGVPLDVENVGGACCRVVDWSEGNTTC
jgi:hypothetical protein